MKKLLIIAALATACGTVPKDLGRDIVLQCNGQQIVVSPGSVVVGENGSITVRDIAADSIVHIPAAVGCLVTDLPLHTVPKQPEISARPADQKDT